MAGTENLTMISHSLEDTQSLGALIGQLLEGDEVICLEGELGTGKTSLIQAIARAQGVREPVTSPTFTLVNLYQGRSGTIHHIDLYRLDSAREILQAGIDAYLHGDGVCLIEWAEKARDILPPDHLYVLLKHSGGDTRTITIKARGASHRLLLDRLRQELEAQT